MRSKGNWHRGKLSISSFSRYETAERGRTKVNRYLNLTIRKLISPLQKHLFLDSYVDLKDPVEKELLYHQIVGQIREDKFPISEQEAVMLCALKAQSDFGDHVPPTGGMSDDGDYQPIPIDYRAVVQRCLPTRLSTIITAESIRAHHQTMTGMDTRQAKQAFFNLIQSWPLHRSTIFDVQQRYTSAWPKNLWLAINQSGLHLLQMRSRVRINRFVIFIKQAHPALER